MASRITEHEALSTEDEALRRARVVGLHRQAREDYRTAQALREQQDHRADADLRARAAEDADRWTSS